MIELQALAYEMLAPLGPELAALFAGFAVTNLSGELFLTNAGERYLERETANDRQRL